MCLSSLTCFSFFAINQYYLLTSPLFSSFLLFSFFPSLPPPPLSLSHSRLFAILGFLPLLLSLIWGYLRYCRGCKIIFFQYYFLFFGSRLSTISCNSYCHTRVFLLLQLSNLHLDHVPSLLFFLDSDTFRIYTL